MEIRAFAGYLLKVACHENAMQNGESFTKPFYLRHPNGFNGGAQSGDAT